MAELTDRVEVWRRRGANAGFRGRRIFTMQRNGEGPPLVLLHGFPSSSYDWRLVLERRARPRRTRLRLPRLRALGQAARHANDLFEQADLTEALVGGWADGPVVLVAHDMGTSVATELLARDLEGRLGFGLRSVLLSNGSMIVERASLTRGQRLLRSPLGPLASQLPLRPVFAREFGALFSPAHPLSPEELEDQWALWTRAGGARNAHRLIAYIDQRVRFAARWHGALRDWPGELRLAWGLRDPVATTNVLDGGARAAPGRAGAQSAPSWGTTPSSRTRSV